MSRQPAKSFEALVGVILLFYAIPIAIWVLYTNRLASLEISWLAFSFGMLLLFFGSAAMLIWVKSREMSSPEFSLAESFQDPTFSTLNQEESDFEGTLTALKEDKENLNRSLQESVMERDELLNLCHSLKEELATATQASAKTIEDLRNALNEKQQQSSQLENQIHDLRYEIKTLLHLTEIDFSPKESANKSREASIPFVEESHFYEQQLISNDEEAKLLLKTCIENAQKITGAYQIKQTARHKHLPVDHYTLDLRLLFDALRAENGALISVFSLNDHKMIFANHQSKLFLGYSPEKFIQDFSHIIENSLTEWNLGVSHLLTRSEVSLKLTMISKHGESFPISCHLALIPAGIFRGLAIMVAYMA